MLHKSLEEIKNDGNDEANKLLQEKIDQLKLDFDAKNWKQLMNGRPNIVLIKMIF